MLKKIIVVGLFLLLLALIWWWLVPSPSPATRLRSVCLAESRSCLALPLSGRDTLYLSSEEKENDLLHEVSECGDSVLSSRYGTAVLLSAGGVFAISADLSSRPSLLPSADSMTVRLRRQVMRLDSLLFLLKRECTALKRYAATHSPIDDGYHDVMRHEENEKRRLQSATRLRQLLSQALCQKSLRPSSCCSFRLYPCLAEDSLHVLSLSLPAVVLDEDKAERFLLLRAEGKGLPRWMRPFLPGHCGTLSGKKAARALLLGIPRFNISLSERGITLPDALSLGDTVMGMPLLRGAAVVTPGGRLCGVWGRHGVVPASVLRSTLSRHVSLPVQLWQRVCRSCRDLFSPSSFPSADTVTLSSPLLERNLQDGCRLKGFYHRLRLVSGALYEGRCLRCPEGDGRMTYADRSVYEGRWRTGKREGWGCLLRPGGGRMEGLWRGDTIPQGLWQRGDTLYAGCFNASLQPEGEGWEKRLPLAYYSGSWQAGQRSGFGLSYGEGRGVRCGTWRAGRFLGERMVYTKDRVYGIDISRYQHGKGRKKYPILWKDLRITHLGYSGRRVEGDVDYPVSFVYIKATQGTSITNPFYAQDARDARRHNIPVGAYHFFSPKRGALQAAYFLRRARPLKSDLPPMLDVELTESQIRKMGGEAVMFREMGTWLARVERALGKRPLLYVSQTFVTRHLEHAPQNIRRHPVWIARYGEYKPYVHLAYWQVSPFGRVKGIRGEVDINVFSGTKEQFRLFIGKK